MGMRAFHVTSVRNRDSIAAHGLDVRLMGAAPGIAGSRHPEVEGVFVTLDRFDAEFFVRMNNTGTPVDVWTADDLDADALVRSENGFQYLPGTIAPSKITLAERDVVAEELVADSGSAYSSTLTIRFDDGRVVTGEDAHRELGLDGS